LSQQGITVYGDVGENLDTSISYIPHGTSSIGLLGLTVIGRTVDEKLLSQLFTELKENSEFQIVTIHWGNEYKLVHNIHQERLAELLVSLGADLIVGHHPHVVQDVDLVDGVPVFYSLGNFIFDQYFSDPVQTGLLVELQYGPKSYLQLRPVTSLDQQTAPRAMTSEEELNFLNDLAMRSDPNLTEAIKAGKLELE